MAIQYDRTMAARAQALHVTERSHAMRAAGAALGALLGLAVAAPAGAFAAQAESPAEAPGARASAAEASAAKAPDTATKADESRRDEGMAHAELKNARGVRVGTVRIRETADGSILTARFQGLPTGTHGFHVHEVGKCEPPFESAGGHFNPTDKTHGFAGKAGWHRGDMPNLDIRKDGSLEVSYFLPGVSVTGGDSPLLGGDGSALVVHSDADDYHTDPAGNAGERIACGVVDAGAMTGAERPAS